MKKKLVKALQYSLPKHTLKQSRNGSITVESTLAGRNFKITALPDNWFHVFKRIGFEKTKADLLCNFANPALFKINELKVKKPKGIQAGKNTKGFYDEIKRCSALLYLYLKRPEGEWTGAFKKTVAEMTGKNELKSSVPYSIITAIYGGKIRELELNYAAYWQPLNLQNFQRNYLTPSGNPYITKFKHLMVPLLDPLVSTYIDAYKKAKSNIKKGRIK